MKQCIHGTKAYCIWCWKKWRDEYEVFKDSKGKYGGFPTKKQFDNDKISAGTTIN